MKLDPFLTSRTKINSKRIKDLHGRAKAMKLTEENTGVNLHDLGLSNDFSDTPSKAE